MLRIISGQWRSRKIIFEDTQAIRPTHDRIRETIFNWLHDCIENAVCLDAFAGSGALGFEALSRGAKKTVFYDVSERAIYYLNHNKKILRASNAVIFHGDFLQQATFTEKFDIIFLDPPYQKNYLLPALHLLLTKKLLSQNALIYFEYEKNSVDLTKIDEQFHIVKQASTQRIEYGLLKLA